MAINIDGDGLIALGGTASTQGRLRLAEDTDNGTNFIELTAPASVGSDRTITFPDGTGAAVVNGVNGSIVSGTSQASTSGTSIDFTGIPAYVKRITVMFQGVSTNGTSDIQFRLGTSGGIEATGYLGATCFFAGGSVTSANISTGFGLGTTGAASLKNGFVVFNNLNLNNWACNGLIGESNAAILSVLAGSKSLSATLDRVRITTVNGTDAFDAGSINILFE